jgi:hypothetical protein
MAVQLCGLDAMGGPLEDPDVVPINGWIAYCMTQAGT